MTDKEIISKSLGFLMSEYSMKFIYNTNGNEYFYYFQNNNGSFNYYEWPQFGDKQFSVVINNIGKKLLNFELDYPDLIREYKRKHSGLLWLFKDQRKDYWDTVALIVKQEIQTKGTLFGLKL